MGEEEGGHLDVDDLGSRASQDLEGSVGMGQKILDGFKRPVDFLGKLKPNRKQLNSVAHKMLLQRQRDALSKMSKERIKCLKTFAEQNVMESRKLVAMRIPHDKAELSSSNRRRMRDAYKHPFEKIPEEVYMTDEKPS